MDNRCHREKTVNFPLSPPYIFSLSPPFSPPRSSIPHPAWWKYILCCRSEKPKKKIVKRQLVLIIVEHWCFLWVMGLRIHKQIRKALRESAGNKSFLLGLSKAYEVVLEFIRLTA